MSGNGMMLFPEDSDNPVIKLETKTSDAEIAKNLILPFKERTAISRQNSDILRYMSIYSAGYPITVDYFRKLDSYIHKKTADITLPLLNGDYVDKSFDLIKSLEMKLDSELSIDPNVELAEWSITGEGTMYPGTDPRVGDAFIYKFESGHMGLFIIDSSNPLSISSDSMFHITFHLFRSLTLEMWKKMMDSVVNTYIFDKETYFNSNGSLMTSQERVNIDESEKFIKKLLFDLHANYYNNEYNSFIIPFEGGPRYDAFFVEFYNHITENEVGFKRPVQLLERYKEDMMKNTIWYKFMNSEDMTPVAYKYHARCKYVRSYYDAYKSNLTNRAVLGLTSTTDQIVAAKRLFSNNIICTETYRAQNAHDVPYYVVSSNFYRLINGEPIVDEDEFMNDDLIIVKFESYDELPVTEDEVDCSISDFEKCLFNVKNNDWTEETIGYIRSAIIEEYPFNGLMNPFRAYQVLLSIYILKSYVYMLKKAI